MAAVANGLTVFIRTGGRMRLVASPNLSEEDATAIAAGLLLRFLRGAAVKLVNPRFCRDC
jgi:hypothetical protein